MMEKYFLYFEDNGRLITKLLDIKKANDEFLEAKKMFKNRNVIIGEVIVTSNSFTKKKVFIFNKPKNRDILQDDYGVFK